MRLAALLFLASAAMAQQNPDRVRSKVLDDMRRVPRYTCTQTIDRAEYRPQYSGRPEGCDALIGARAKLPSPGYVTWHDRLRLEVAVLNGKETFAWAGARQFETTDIERLTSSGSSGSGDFASFLSGIFGDATTRISFLGDSLFAFTVPVDRSSYRYRSGGSGAERVIGYHGTFLVDDANAELKRLTVDADRFPSDEQMCRVEDVMEYHRVKIGDGDFLLPETSKMTVLFNNGKESRNQTHYSDCREYGAESSIRFGDEDPAPRASSSTQSKSAPGKLPPHRRLQIGLKSPIHSETAAAGDSVTGVIVRDVKDAARANDIVHGRILRLEQYLFPVPRWVVALRFETIERNGVEQPLDLMPVKGDGVFTFPGRGNLVLDQKFHSEWETR